MEGPQSKNRESRPYPKRSFGHGTAYGVESGSGDWNVGKTILVDEGRRSHPKLSADQKELIKKAHLLANQHLLNEDGTDLKSSAVIKQPNLYLIKGGGKSC